MDAQAVIDSFTQGLERAITAAGNACSGKNHAHAPAAYNGTRAEYETFRRGLELYVKAISKDKDKIIAALSFLTSGDADAWAQNFMQDHAGRVDRDAFPWEEFLTLLDKKFLDPRTAEYAREQLFRMTQGRQDTDSFFLKFDELRVKGGLTAAVYHDKILVEHLKKHMNPQLVMSVQTAHEAQAHAVQTVLNIIIPGLQGNAKTEAEAAVRAELSYKQFRELAIEHDPAVRRFRYQGHSGGPRAPQSEPRRYQAPPAPPPAPVVQVVAPAAPVPPHDPMDLDRARAQNRGVCYCCCKPGHIARDCKERDIRKVIRNLTKEEFEEAVRDRLATAYAEVEEVQNPKEDFANPQ